MRIKMKELMALAAGLPTIFQDRNGDHGANTRDLSSSNRHWIAVEIGLSRAQIGNADRLPGLTP